MKRTMNVTENKTVIDHTEQLNKGRDKLKGATDAIKN